ncbi:polysaccharide biosynthesis protein [Yoonia sp.]|uniref:polysaccharide biosynthesis protein n=1 Tax=Yoonia sp. TaxID=2212373 RepID=UPI002FD9D3A6
MSRRRKVALQMSLDAVLIVFCFLAAMTLRWDHLYFLERASIWWPVATSLPATLIAFWYFGLYRSMMRFVTSNVVEIIAKSVAISAVIMYVTNMILTAGVPRSVPFIYAVLLFLSVGFIRFAVRHYFHLPIQSKKTPVVIYGAGDAGRDLLNSLVRGRDYAPVGFIDDDPSLHRLSIGGIPVMSPKALEVLTEDLGVTVVLLAIPRIDRARRRQIIARCQDLRLEIKTIPTVSDIVDGVAKVSDLRQVTPDELLGRDPVAPDSDLLARNIAGKAVMITGAGGSIGSELCRQVLAQKPQTLVLYELSELALYLIEAELSQVAARTGLDTVIVPVLGNTQDRGRVDETVATHSIKTIFHAAAYKHVPLVEDNIAEGLKNNVFGTLTVAQVAQAHRVENVILISTDKAVRPTNVMGVSKRIAELICSALAQDGGATVFSMVRFGNVLGSSGSVIPRFQKQIEAGGPVTVTHPEISRYFMTIPEASQLVIQAGAMAAGGDVFVLDMGEPVRIADLAETMIRLHGLTPYRVDHPEEVFPDKGDIPICFTGLRKGEKLHEELLIGEVAEQTRHPRIMKASELALRPDQLMPVLDRLFSACRDNDVTAIRAILHDLPLGYRPTQDSPMAVLDAPGMDVDVPRSWAS